ncbi:MAG: hypothetical protein ACREQ9_07940 [Candidatus Binatia bacterium]
MRHAVAGVEAGLRPPVVDPDEPRIEIYELAGGAYARTAEATTDGAVAPRLFPGLEIRVADLVG